MFGKSSPPPERSLTRRWLRRLLIVLVVALLTPVALAALYRVLPPPLTPLMVIRALEGDGAERSWVSLDSLPGHVPLAVIAAEDNLFCEHGGFDWDAIGNAISDARAGRKLRGASTISMQVTRNLFLWPGGGWARKGLEALWTPPVELLLGKRRIIEIYLNIAETGIGTFGFDAAARRYYGKPATELSRREAAAIAAILPNPREWSPERGGAGRRIPVLARRKRDIAPMAGCVEAGG